MATEAVLPINGNYGAPSHTSSHSASLTNGATEQAASGGSPPKDEVGWYFVEQYYTTMSRSPEKVHLFYNKRSQFVYGVEAEKVPVSVGQKAINERISELGIEDCKVRVTNVDSQESGKSIVLQVIGEMSVKGQPHRKFAQTFVLAEQPNGYFVLNDIFRYIADEPEDDELETAVPEEETEEAPAAESQVDIKNLTSSDNLAEQAKDADVVDKKLEQATAEETPAIESAPPPASDSVGEATGSASQAVDKADDVDVTKPEAPKDPEPTPVATPAPAPAPAPAQAPKEPAAPPKPAAPKTWASMLGGGKAPVPVVPTVPIQQGAQSQAKAAPAAATVAAAAAAPASAATAAATSTPAAATAVAPAQATASENTEMPASPGGWQTAGQDHGKKQNRNQAGGVVNGYIKNVTPNVEAAALKQALAQHGKVTYFDISRPKNCAFVEFETPAGFNAAVAANPHKVNGEDIMLEERRPRANTYGNNFRGGMRGNRNSMDGRTPSQGGRGGFKDNRGGFIPRGRGGAAGRGRGGTGQEA